MKKLNFIILLLIVTGCHDKRIEGLKVESIEFANRIDIQKYIGDNYKSSIIDYWTNDDFLIVNALIDKEVIDYVKENNSTFLANIYFCDMKDTVVTLGLSHIFKNKISSGDVINKIKYFHENESDIYNFILLVSWSKNNKLSDSLKKKKDQSFYHKYDLRSHPNDICISIVGTNMMFSYKTNEIRLTKEQIEKVLNQKGL